MREPKIDVVDLLRDEWTNPNTALNSTGGKAVFPDYPRIDLKYASYPRISIIETNSNSEWMGIGSKKKKTTAVLEIAIWVKEANEKDQLIKIDNVVYSEEKLVDHIKSTVLNILQNKWATMDADDYLDYRKISEGEILFDIDRKSYFKPVTIELDYIQREE